MISRQFLSSLRNTPKRFLLPFLAVCGAFICVQSSFAQQNDFDSVHIQPRPRMLAQTEAPPNAIQAPTQPQPPSQGYPTQGTLEVPAGTTLPLVLARPLSLKHTQPGDTAYLQTTFPVSVGGQMAIPPGTFLQGTIERVTRRDKSRRVLAFDLRSAVVIFSTGYTVNVPGSLEANPVLAGSTPPGTNGGSNVPVLAATGGPTLPPLPPLPGSGARNAIIGVGIAATVGIIVTSVVLVHNSDVLMEPGVSMQALLTYPLELEQDRVMVAVQQYSAQTAGALPQIPSPPPSTGTCWTAAVPGTPDTVIPGTPPTIIPGTPPTTIPGDPPTVIPGTPPITIPGTPDTVIQGTPARDPEPYPCPK